MDICVYGGLTEKGEGKQSIRSSPHSFTGSRPQGYESSPRRPLCFGSCARYYAPGFPQEITRHARKDTSEQRNNPHQAQMGRSC